MRVLQILGWVALIAIVVFVARKDDRNAPQKRIASIVFMVVFALGAVRQLLVFMPLGFWEIPQVLRLWGLTPTLSVLLSFFPGLWGLFNLLDLVFYGAMVAFFFTKANRDKEETSSAFGAGNMPPHSELRQGKNNLAVRVSLYGGLIGSSITNPRKALESVIQKYNAEGWNCHRIIPHETRNILVSLLQGVLLVITLFMFTFSGAYLLLLERDTADYGGMETN